MKIFKMLFKLMIGMFLPQPKFYLLVEKPRKLHLKTKKKIKKKKNLPQLL